MSDATPKPILTGGCQCGAVRYAISGVPDRVHLCHCRMCQKAVGGPFAAYAPVRRDELVWTRGAPAEFASSSVVKRLFCPACGTPLGFGYHERDRIGVTLGSLDRPEEVPPERHYGIERRLAWLSRIDTLPSETTGASMPAELARKLVSYQHPDHDTPADWSPPR